MKKFLIMSVMALGMVTVYATDLFAKPSITIHLTCKPFRGQKWSEAHNVKPCTSGVGICDINISVDIDPLGLYQPIILSGNEGQDEIEITFESKIQAKDGDIFFGEEEASLILPDEVAKAFGKNKLSILPSNYIFHIDAEHPFGYVKLKVYGE